MGDDVAAAWEAARRRQQRRAVMIVLLMAIGCLGYACYLYQHAQSATDEEMLRPKDHVALNLLPELTGLNDELRRARDAGDKAKVGRLERALAEERARHVAERASANRAEDRMTAYLAGGLGALVLVGVGLSQFRTGRSPASGGSP